MPWPCCYGSHRRPLPPNSLRGVYYTLIGGNHLMNFRQFYWKKLVRGAIKSFVLCVLNLDHNTSVGRCLQQQCEVSSQSQLIVSMKSCNPDMTFGHLWTLTLGQGHDTRLGGWQHLCEREKGSDLTQSHDNSPSPTEKSKKQRDNTNKNTKTSITRLRIDLERPVGVTTDIPLVW